jgi:hypothetical protein
LNTSGTGYFSDVMRVITRVTSLTSSKIILPPRHSTSQKRVANPWTRPFPKVNNQEGSIPFTRSRIQGS